MTRFYVGKTHEPESGAERVSAAASPTVKVKIVTGIGFCAALVSFYTSFYYK